MRRIGLRWTALLLGLVLLLSGCATIPRSGPVEEVGVQPNNTGVSVEIAPDPPSPGASPREVVEGFLQAMANYQTGYQVAREYLMPEVRDTWRPEDGVLVYADGYSVTATPESVLLSAPVVGRIGSDLSYRESAEQIRHDFGVAADPNGEWRIANPPQGLLISHYLFNQFYQQVNVYYYDPSYTTLVPDPIFLPQGNQNATTLMQALLRGPSQWLGAGAVSAIPPQTRLSVNAAPITADQVVDVSLSEQITGLGEDQRSRIAGQIIWTLSQVSGVNGVRITVNGAPYAVREQNAQGILPVPGMPWLDPIPWQKSDQTYGLVSHGLVRLNRTARETDRVPVAGALGTTGGLTSVAVNLPGDRVAVVNAAGEVYVGDPEQPAGLVLQAEGMLRPQFGRSTEQELWTVSAAGVQLVHPDRVVPVQAHLDGRIQAFRLSPDGVRMAVVREVGGRTELGLLRVNRSDDVPVLEEFRAISLGGSIEGPVRFVDVGWLDATSLIVLAASGDGPVKPYRVDQSGSDSAEIGQPDNWQAWAVASQPDRFGGRASIVGRNGAWRYDGDYRWPTLATDVLAVGYPGG